MIHQKASLIPPYHEWTLALQNTVPLLQGMQRHKNHWDIVSEIKASVQADVTFILKSMPTQ